MEKCKRYLLFTFVGYYPGGGKADYCGSFDSLEDARESYQESKMEYGEVLDIGTGKWHYL